METLLAADIGGTKSELAIVAAEGDGGRILRQERYRNRDFTGPEAVIAAFLAATGDKPRRASIAAAGLVEPGAVQFTNLPWRLESAALQSAFLFDEVLLINDLTAVAMAVGDLAAHDLAVIQEGRVVPGEICGVIAPGTGLGEGMRLDLPTGVWVRGSEGGHCDFAPTDDEQRMLLAWLARDRRPISYECLIGGPGIARLYEFCRDHLGLPECVEARAALSAGQDPVPVIVAGAVRQEPCPLCRRAIDLFLTILGSEAGNLALKLFARGGVYLGGGILPRLYGKVPFAGFLRSFHAKGHMAGLMTTIPVHLILRQDAAVLGAASYGLAASRGLLLGTAHG